MSSWILTGMIIPEWEASDIKKAHAKAMEMFGDRQVTPLVNSRSGDAGGGFFIFCSGFSTRYKDEEDAKFKEFASWLEEKEMDWTWVTYHSDFDDELETGPEVIDSHQHRYLKKLQEEEEEAL